MRNSQRPPSKAGLACCLLPLLCGLAAFITFAVIGDDDDTDSPQDNTPSAYDARTMCEKFIVGGSGKNYLKSPASAEFSGDSETKVAAITDKPPWRFIVTGYVDSQNGFGAMLRSSYVCDVSTKDNKAWNLGDVILMKN